MTLAVRQLEAVDLDTTDAVVRAAFRSTFSRRPEIERLLRLQPDGWLIAELDGFPAGAVATVCYGSFAYVGLMSVRPELQRRGIGLALMTRLLDVVAAHGCDTTLLDATDAGHPLYLRLGFVEESRTLQFAHTALGGRKARSGAEPFHADDLAAVAAFDAPLFGADRRAVIASYRADAPRRSFLVRDDSGEVAGYLIARANYLGPWAARNAVIAEALLTAALTLDYPEGVLVNVPAENTAAQALLGRYGFERRRSLPHMRRGPPVPRRRELQFAQASFATG